MSTASATLPLCQEAIGDGTWENAPASSPQSCEEGAHLAAQVEHALCATGYACLRSVTATLRDQAVVLQGRVPSYYLKQVAQEMALTVPEVRELRNELLVVRSA